MATQGYKDDLAYVHDVGFTSYARNAAPGLLQILRTSGVTNGLIVDLGCGSGRWVRELNQSGYDVLGVDQSPAMIRLAHRNAPKSRFQVASLLSVKLPSCDAITSIGECINYCFDEKNSRKELARLFQRAYRALRPGGLLLFDIAEPTRFPKQAPHKIWAEGKDWAILVAVDGDSKQHLLRRQITCFRKVGRQYRRSGESHTLRLYWTRDLIDDLTKCGFQARKLSGYGAFRFPPGIAGVLAIKP